MFKYSVATKLHVCILLTNHDNTQIYNTKFSQYTHIFGSFVDVNVNFIPIVVVVQIRQRVDTRRQSVGKKQLPPLGGELGDHEEHCTNDGHREVET